jgi:hypothetical protein
MSPFQYTTSVKQAVFAIGVSNCPFNASRYILSSLVGRGQNRHMLKLHFLISASCVRRQMSPPIFRLILLLLLPIRLMQQATDHPQVLVSFIAICLLCCCCCCCCIFALDGRKEGLKERGKAISRSVDCRPLCIRAPMTWLHQTKQGNEEPTDMVQKDLFYGNFLSPPGSLITATALQYYLPQES